MGIFSISKKESEYFNDKRKFIELVNCPQGGKNCIEHRKLINNNIINAREHFIDKNFPQSIEELRIAFDKTTELQQKSCINCAALFRQTITNSMEKIHLDLEKMSKGFFKSSRHQTSYLLAAEVLKDFKRNIR
ncbi:hypothetical protein ACUNWD_18540 [Sunxiuqinia sp. A32]|uniref:hypothetical protein n=1 Tax=Sunxiuqinia sp. A32 TaxID=3461496 RepID=UPI004045B310